MADELDGMATFVAVAETRGFRAAGERLGSSHSAVSHTIRRLEERLGVTLVQRSTRSVRLTEAGKRLYASVRPALDEVRAGVAAVGELGDAPRGKLRLHMSSVAVTIIAEPLLAGFLAEHPHVQLDIVVSEAPIDIVAEGYDAGIQLGEVIEKDMIALSVTGDLRLAVVGAPSYFARRGFPKHPRDLMEHDEPFPGYYLYHPHRRHASRPLRALIEHLHRWRRRRGMVLLSRDADHERIAAFVGHSHRATFPTLA